jgi:predicted SnoaL-like aldol condensation-catalyzing enzyme
MRRHQWCLGRSGRFAAGGRFRRSPNDATMGVNSPSGRPPMPRLLAAVLLLAVVAGGARAAEAARSTAQEEANKSFVTAFYDAVFNKHDLAAVDRDIGATYIQHNPAAADGKAALKAFMAPYFQANPGAKATILRSAADGDLVFLHVHAQASDQDPGVAVVDIFRVADGKIVEHWDVVQRVPDRTASGHPVF